MSESTIASRLLANLQHHRRESRTCVSILSIDEADDEQSSGPRRPRPRPVPAQPQPTVVHRGGGGGGGDSTDDDGGGTPSDTTQGFTSLDVAAESAVDRYMRRQATTSKVKMHCFMCDFDRHSSSAELQTGRQKPVLMSASYGYTLMINYYNEHGLDDEASLAEHMTFLYTKHVWRPAKRACKGADPPSLPHPKDLNISRHIMFHTLEPTNLLKFNIRNMQKLILTCNEKIVVEDVPDPQMARTVIDATRLLHNMNMEQLKLLVNAGVGQPLKLDRQRVLAVASTRPIDAFRAQVNDTLGGATATDSTLTPANVAAQRPAFGASVARDISSVEPDNGEGEEDSMLE